MSFNKFLSWNLFWDSKKLIKTNRGDFNVYFANEESDLVIFCAHGAGHSGLTFSLLTEKLKEKYCIIAPDLKCHGDTNGDPSIDLSIENLVEDFNCLINTIVNSQKKIVLLGHSLGGTIVTFSAKTIKCLSLIVIDTIEGLSIEQMPAMKEFLLSRPNSFSSINETINYISTSGEMQNFKSAAISTLGRFNIDNNGILTWKTDLIKSENHWKGWFQGFSNTFLSIQTYKVLILPNINRLDTPFTIAHMEGKFQLSVILNTNHCVHEDSPLECANVIIKLIERIYKKK